MDKKFESLYKTSPNFNHAIIDEIHIRNFKEKGYPKEILDSQLCTGFMQGDAKEGNITYFYHGFNSKRIREDKKDYVLKYIDIVKDIVDKIGVEYRIIYHKSPFPEWFYFKFNPNNWKRAFYSCWMFRTSYFDPNVAVTVVKLIEDFNLDYWNAYVLACWYTTYNVKDNDYGKPIIVNGDSYIVPRKVITSVCFNNNFDRNSSFVRNLINGIPVKDKKIYFEDILFSNESVFIFNSYVNVPIKTNIDKRGIDIVKEFINRHGFNKKAVLIVE